MFKTYTTFGKKNKFLRKESSMSDTLYNWLKFAALTIVPICNFVFLILTTCGVMDATIAATIIGGIDVLVGAIVTAAKKVWENKQKKSTKKKTTKKKAE